MTTMKKSYQRRLGVRATAYIEDNVSHSIGGVRMVADSDATPQGVARTLTRVFGRPRIPGAGEVAYWLVDEAY